MKNRAKPVKRPSPLNSVPCIFYSVLSFSLTRGAPGAGAGRRAPPPFSLLLLYCLRFEGRWFPRCPGTLLGARLCVAGVHVHLSFYLLNRHLLSLSFRKFCPATKFLTALTRGASRLQPSDEIP